MFFGYWSQPWHSTEEKYAPAGYVTQVVQSVVGHFIK
jgi:hypothetical protein